MRKLRTAPFPDLETLFNKVTEQERVKTACDCSVRVSVRKRMFGAKSVIQIRQSCEKEGDALSRSGYQSSGRV